MDCRLRHLLDEVDVSAASYQQASLPPVPGGLEVANVLDGDFAKPSLCNCLICSNTPFLTTVCIRVIEGMSRDPCDGRGKQGCSPLQPSQGDEFVMPNYYE